MEHLEGGNDSCKQTLHNVAFGVVTEVIIIMRVADDGRGRSVQLRFDRN